MSKCEAQSELTLEQCIDRAKQSSFQFRQALGAIRGAELARAELTTLGLPSVVVSSTASFAPSYQHFGYDPALTDEGQLSAQVGIEQSIYDGGAKSIRTRQATLEEERLTKLSEVIERELRFSVTESYIETLRSSEEVRIRLDGLGRLQSYLDIVTGLSRGGSASYTDVLKTRIELANDSLSLQEAEAAKVDAKCALAELIGQPGDTNFTPSGTLDGLSVGPRDPDIIRTRANPDSSSNIRLAKLQTKIGSLDVDLSKHEKNPEISAFADAGLLTSVANLRMHPPERSSMVGYSIGLQLRLPLFDWGGRRLRQQQRQIVVDSLVIEEELVRRAVSFDLAKLQRQLVEANRRLSSIRANIDAAQQNFLLTQAKFTSGAALSLEVLSAEQLLNESRLAELQSLAELQTVSARLEQLLTP